MHDLLRSIAPFLLAVATMAAPALAADTAQGQKVFQICAACHAGTPGAMGPNLHGVVGRAAGAIPDFHYSGPMKRSGLTWTPAALHHYLTDPQGTVPGNRMPLSPLSPADADAVIKYLATLK